MPDIQPPSPSGVGDTIEYTTFATVEIGPVPTDDDARYVNNDDPLGVVTDYIINNRYERDGHVWYLGVTSPGGFQGASAAFVQLAAKTLVWISDWTACRFNGQPDIPTPDVADANWVLLDEHLEPVSVVTGPDGRTPLYRISGTYVYGNKRPELYAKLVNYVRYGRVPWLKDDFDRTMPESKLKADLKDGNGHA